MEKFLWILLFSRLFPAPSGYGPLTVWACRAAVEAQRGGFSAKQKREFLYPFAKHEVLRFPHGPNLQFICFPMLYSHCNMPPARQCAESEAVKKKFLLAAPFFSHLQSYLPGPPQPSLPQTCPSQGTSEPLPHFQHTLHLLLTPEMAVGLLLPNVIVRSKSELALPSCSCIQLQLPLSLKQCHFLNCIFTK